MFAVQGLTGGVIALAGTRTDIVLRIACKRPQRLGQMRVASLIDQHDSVCLAILLPRLT
jgi:hypothetical protein